MNHEGPYFVAVFLHNIVFAQLGLIPRTCCRVPLKYKSCRIKTIKQAHVPNMLSCKTTWWKNFYEKGKNYSYLIHNIVSLSKMDGKPYSWRYVEYELVVKYLKDLAIEKKCCCFECFQIKHLIIFRLWVIVFTQERASRQTFIYSKSTIETLQS